MKNKNNQMKMMILLIGIAIILGYLIRLPLFPSMPFIKYDPTDVSILIGTFLFGPISGLLLSAIAALIQGFTINSGGGIIEMLMHFIASASYVIVAGNIYKRKNTRKGVLLGLSFGSIAMIICMIMWNVFFMPVFLGIPTEEIVSLILPIILPSYFFKAVIDIVLTYVCYICVEKALSLEIDLREDKAEISMSLKNWMLTILICNLPVVNLIMLFVWSLKDNINTSKKQFASASLVFAGIGITLSLIYLSRMRF